MRRSRFTHAEANRGVGFVRHEGTLGFLRDRIRQMGFLPVCIDTSLGGEPSDAPDITSRQVAAAAGADIEERDQAHSPRRSRRGRLHRVREDALQRRTVVVVREDRAVG